MKQNGPLTHREHYQWDDDELLLSPNGDAGVEGVDVSSLNKAEDGASLRSKHEKHRCGSKGDVTHQLIKRVQSLGNGSLVVA